MASRRGRRAARGSVNAKRVRGSTKITAADRELLAIPQGDWSKAKHREQLVKLALRRGDEAAAQGAGCSRRTIRRLRARYELNPTLLSLIPRRTGPPIGSGHIGATREALVERAIDIWTANREPLPVSRLVEEVDRLTRAAGLQAVARDTSYYVSSICRASSKSWAWRTPMRGWRW